jgi:8-oxo-dGTP diphosphatase
MPADYPKPSVTVDTIIFAMKDSEIFLLLIERKHDPFKGKWAIPGGFVDINESLADAACRELKEETTLTNVELEQFHSYGDPGRDPRGRTITVSYRTLLAKIPGDIKGADDAADARWFPIDALPELAFDHQKIITAAKDALRADLQTVIRATSWFDNNLKISDLRTMITKLN